MRDTYARLVVHPLTSLGDGLAVRLHVSLLEVVRELVQILVVRQERMGLGAVEVVVPDTEDREEDGQVLLERRGLEVLVHAVRALEELLDIVVADDERDRQTGGTPEGVPTADPVPELEHVRLGDAEGSDRLRVRGERDEVLRDVRLVLGRCEEPIAGALRVRNGLLRGERLAGNDEQSRLGVAETEGLR